MRIKAFELFSYLRLSGTRFHADYCYAIHWMYGKDVQNRFNFQSTHSHCFVCEMFWIYSNKRALLQSIPFSVCRLRMQAEGTWINIRLWKTEITKKKGFRKKKEKKKNATQTDTWIVNTHILRQMSICLFIGSDVCFWAFKMRNLNQYEKW